MNNNKKEFEGAMVFLILILILIFIIRRTSSWEVRVKICFFNSELLFISSSSCLFAL